MFDKFAAFHDEEGFFEHGDVQEGVGGEGDQVGVEAWGDTADVFGAAEELGGA